MPGEDLKFAAETLERAAEDVSIGATTFETVSETLQRALESGVEQPQAEGVLQQLQATLSGIEDGRTQDLAASLADSTGVINAVQAADADVGQLQAVTDNMDQYLSQLGDVQTAFSSGELGRSEAEERYNTLLDESVESLREQADAIGLTGEQVDELAGRYEQVREAQRQYLDDMQSGEAVSAFRAQFESFSETAQGQLEQISVGAAGVEANLVEAFSNPKAAVVALAAGGVALLVNEFAELDNATQQFVARTGRAASGVDGVRERTQALRRDLALSGLELDDLADATVRFSDEFGSLENAAVSIDSSFGGISDPVEALQRETVAVAGRLNLSGEEAAELVSEFQGLSEATGASRENLQTSAMEAARIADVAPKAVMQDIADNSEQLAKFSGQSGEELATAAARARQLGTNIGEVAGLQEKILTDIPGFIQGIEQASAITPELALDPGALARSAAEGTDSLVGELEAQLSGRDFSDLDFFTQQRLEDALGLSAQQIQRISERSQNAALSFEELQGQVQVGEASLEQLFNASEGATALTELRRQAGALGVTLVQALAPAIEAIAAALRVVVTGINSAVEVVSSLAGTIGDGVSAMRRFGDAMPNEQMRVLGVNLAMLPLASTVGLLGDAAAVLGEWGAVVGGIAAVGGTGYLLVKLFSSVTDAAKTMGGGLKSVLSGAASTLKDFVKGTVDALFGAAQRLLDGFAGIIDSLSNVVNSVVNLIGDAFVKALRFAGKGIAAFSQAIVAAAPGVPVLIGLSAAAAGLGAALWLATPAIDAVVSGVVSLVDVLVGGALGFVEQLRMTIVSIADVGPTLFVAAGGVAALAGSLALFASTLAGASFATAVSNFTGMFGGGPIDKIERLAEIGPRIREAGRGITDISEGLRDIGELEDIEPGVDAATTAIRRIQDVAEPAELEAVGQASQPSEVESAGSGAAADRLSPGPGEGGTGEQPASTAVATSSSEGLSDEDRSLLREIARNGRTLIELMRSSSGDLYIDGRRVTDALRATNENNAIKL